MPVTSIEISPEMDRRLNEVADDLQQEKNGVIQEALRQYVERMERRSKRHQDTQEALASKARGEYYEGLEVLEWMDHWFTEDEKPEPTLKR
jgi:predicted transcriptional regulator